ncbi:MAG: diacylglycerol kinase family protein [bacterium]|nr:diacylglycerol kinase family protein [bacterium]
MTKPGKNTTISKRMMCAVEGVLFMLKSERNIPIYGAISALAIAGALYFQIGAIEWMLLWLAIFLVCITETLNTAIEYNVDLVTEEWHEKAKISKDVAAGAVLLASCFAGITAYLIFYPRLANLVLGGN